MDKVWKFLTENVKTIVALVTIITMVFGGAFYAYKHYYPKGLIQDIVDKEVALVKTQYEQDLEQRDNEKKAVEAKLKKSQAKVVELNNKIKTLEGKLADVQAPKNIAETKDRFRAAGYPPSR